MTQEEKLITTIRQLQGNDYAKLLDVKDGMGMTNDFEFQRILTNLYRNKKKYKINIEAKHLGYLLPQRKNTVTHIRIL